MVRALPRDVTGAPARQASTRTTAHPLRRGWPRPRRCRPSRLRSAYARPADETHMPRKRDCLESYFGAFSLVPRLQNGHERFLRNVYRANALHALLALFLLLQQLAL